MRNHFHDHGTHDLPGMDYLRKNQPENGNELKSFKKIVVSWKPKLCKHCDFEKEKKINQNGKTCSLHHHIEWLWLKKSIQISNRKYFNGDANCHFWIQLKSNFNLEYKKCDLNNNRNWSKQ